MRYENYRWYDENENSWCGTITEQQAQEYSDSLDNCTRCADCHNCSYCYMCSYCVNCVSCIYCNYSHKCFEESGVNYTTTIEENKK